MSIPALQTAAVSAELQWIIIDQMNLYNREQSNIYQSAGQDDLMIQI